MSDPATSAEAISFARAALSSHHLAEENFMAALPGDHPEYDYFAGTFDSIADDVSAGMNPNSTPTELRRALEALAAAYNRVRLDLPDSHPSRASFDAVFSFAEHDLERAREAMGVA